MVTRAMRRGLELTPLGLGLAQFGNLYRQTTDAEAEGAFAAAWEGGIRYFDTAPHYGLGLSERRIGAMLREKPRDEFVISTKVGRLLVPTPENAGRQDDQGFVVPAAARRVFDFSRDGILRSVESSLERTGLDRLDILYLHDPDDHFEQASTEGIGALIELRDQGVVRAVGAGMNHSRPLAELIRRSDIDVVMLAGRYTLLDQTAEADLMPLALDRGVGVVIAGVYNSGLLGTPRPAAGAKFDYEDASPDLIARVNSIADVCERHGVILPAAAIAYVLRHPAVVSVVVGARSATQLHETLERYQATVPEALWTELAAASLVPAPSATES